MTTATAVRESSCLTRLNTEWDSQYAVLPARYASGALWSQDAPALAGCRTLGDIREGLRTATAAEGDRMLHALLVIGQAGDDKALRTVLQAEMGVVAWLASQAGYRGLEDRQEAALAAMWTAIRRFPLRRTKVAANLKMDGLKCLAQAVTFELPCDTATALDQRPADPQDAADPHDEARILIDWARSQEILPSSTLDLIARRHLTSVGEDYATLALEFGGTPEALRQRYNRGVRQLAAAVRDAMADDALPIAA